MSAILNEPERYGDGLTIRGINATSDLVIDPIQPDDSTILLSVYRDGDGPSVALTPEQARIAAGALLAAATHIDLPGLRAVDAAPLDVLCGTSETDTECVQPKDHDGDHLDIEGRYFR
ncbi:hypothetical protein [Amycolatopsis thermophila]|uniref:Uncharacterized protein n=1 Tax=Amycolatopsis thermophila TaxID=206084 RepID=A0ABU0ESX7_9PSEU|nr:hypothetical protein [Amycolatopsis thermophila]MDQ0377917.1 hypothetical protein [Amycolatopsis thermophila]